jgi:hypothetical protein
MNKMNLSIVTPREQYSGIQLEGPRKKFGKENQT